jgi:hypothetical protein
MPSLEDFFKIIEKDRKNQNIIDFSLYWFYSSVSILKYTLGSKIRSLSAVNGI